VKTLIDLEPGDCRFPFGDRDFMFCAKPQHFHVLNGKLVQSSYCEEHHLICTFVPMPKRAAA
jgi:hypothetical protein